LIIKIREFLASNACRSICSQAEHGGAAPPCGL
jgi:hypothetical protein